MAGPLPRNDSASALAPQQAGGALAHQCYTQPLPELGFLGALLPSDATCISDDAPRSEESLGTRTTFCHAATVEWPTLQLEAGAEQLATRPEVAQHLQLLEARLLLEVSRVEQNLQASCNAMSSDVAKMRKEREVAWRHVGELKEQNRLLRSKTYELEVQNGHLNRHIMMLQEQLDGLRVPRPVTATAGNTAGPDGSFLFPAALVTKGGGSSSGGAPGNVFTTSLGPSGAILDGSLLMQPQQQPYQQQHQHVVQLGSLAELTAAAMASNGSHHQINHHVLAQGVRGGGGGSGDGRATPLDMSALMFALPGGGGAAQPCVRGVQLAPGGAAQARHEVQVQGLW